MNVDEMGVIEEGTLKGRQIILQPREGLKDNEWLVQSGLLLGIPKFSKACLTCEEFIPDNGCGKCDPK